MEERESLSPAHTSRVLIFGSRTSGAWHLQELLQTYSKKEKIPLNFEVCSSAMQVDDYFLGRDNGEVHLPEAIILLPQMILYLADKGMSIDTFNSGVVDVVENLCQKHNVLLFKIRESFDTRKAGQEPSEELLEELGRFMHLL